MKKESYIICAVFLMNTILISLLFTSCEKEIEIPYRSIEKKIAIEGSITNETSKVIITSTRDMEDSVKCFGIKDAIVSLSDENGYSETLVYQEDGYYRSSSGLTGNPGITYTLSVVIEGQEYVSKSTMQPQTTIKSANFKWVKTMNTRKLFYEIEIEDILDDESYYCYRMYRNGENYRWDVFNDKGSENDIINLNITCMDEKTAEDNKEEDKDDILYEGDEITLEIQTIDRRTYDYLYSLGLSERTSTNPIANFSGDCLGYFSAYSTTRHKAVFKYGEVE